MAESGTPQGKKRRSWVLVTIIVVVVVVVAGSVGYVLTPSLSPIPTIRDSDGDGVADAADFWDMGNGGLLIRIERFELIAGACDFLSNCEPSFRLEVDIDRDGVTRRADFEDFLDSEPLINPVEWVFDIPDNMASTALIIVVMELGIGADDEIDVHPDSQYISDGVLCNSPYAYHQYDTQGDQEPIGRLVYSVTAIGV